jgi:hypothetical protein
MDSTENPIALRLVAHFGGRAGAAKRLGRSAETIRLWLENGVPLSQSIDVEHKSGGVVTAEEILQDAKRAKAGEVPKIAA